MLSAPTFEWTKVLYFYIAPQGNEMQEQMRNRLLDKRKERLRHMINMQAMTCQFYSRPMLGMHARSAPEALFSDLVCTKATEATSKAMIHAGTILHCTGILVPLYMLVVYFELLFVHINHVVQHILNNAANHLQAKFHESMCCFWNFQFSRWCDHLNIYQMHHIKSLMFEVTERWESTLADILQTAEENGHLAKWVVAATCINQHAIWQCYAEHMQMLADEHPPERVCPASIEDTICQTFQFEQGLLWDSPYNIEQINFAQDSCTDRDRNPRANAPVRPGYGGQVRANQLFIGGECP